jgi:hypothetical protein
MGTKLAQKAYDAIKLIESSDFKQRAEKLASFDERGFALMLYWNQIEAALKVIRYEHFIKKGWPDHLDFLGTTWKPLQELKKENDHDYQLTLGNPNRSKSLYATRNGIAHEGRNVHIDDYKKYVEAASWTIRELKQRIPNCERLRDKKRRSDAQLVR